jgi:hypothetical protein
MGDASITDPKKGSHCSESEQMKNKPKQDNQFDKVWARARKCIPSCFTRVDSFHFKGKKEWVVNMQGSMWLSGYFQAMRDFKLKHK